MKLQTNRDVIYWEYAKIIAENITGSRRDFAEVTRVFKRLKSGQMSMSSILRENKLLVQSDRVCTYCGSLDNLQWEHIIPRSRGGPDSIDNLVLSCKSCNMKKGIRNPYEWYGKARRDEIPRIVVGKYLKLVFQQHEALGTLDAGGSSGDGKVRLSDLMVAFERRRDETG
jgi:CRISPR/Cas system Type II protein with McrA/HNH and RuvC-like nuclease domain